MTNEVPQYLIDWMRTQSKSAFIGDMLRVWNTNGGLSERQLVEVKVRYIQSGHDIPIAAA
jgi:hypothetical protein